LSFTPAHKLERFFDQVTQVCPLSFDDLEGMMGCRFPEDRSQIGAIALNRLLESLNISIESIMNDLVDYEVITRQLLGNKDIIPGRYLSGPNTSLRFTTAYMIDYLERTYGANAILTIQRHFQICRGELDILTKRNNILLPKDICHYVYQYYGAQAVEEMGKHSVRFMDKCLGISGVKECRTWQELLVKFAFDITPDQVEKNYFWDILACSDSQVIVQGTLNKDLLDGFAKDEVVTVPLERLRKGFILGLLNFYNSGVYQVDQISSMSNGGNADLYIVKKLTSSAFLQ
jgi:hypothetical protein